MAHSHSTAAATTGEIHYYLQDENGKILKVLKQANIKQEPNEKQSEATAVYHATNNTTTSNSGGGKYIKVLKGVGSDIKQEPTETAGFVYAAATNTTTAANINTSSGSSNANMGAFSQMNSTNQSQFVRIQNNYNIPQAENTTYTVITPQSSGSSSTHKYETTDTAIAKSSVGGDRYGGKYTQNNNAKVKSKLNTTQSTPASVQRKRKPDKAGKGLRHFSMKVCEKVKEKGNTTYNEVADELVAEEMRNNSFDSNCDQKNIRRRVYDALNVLMAMHIISKDKKEIRWIGLPTNSVAQCTALEKENEERRVRIDQKHQQLRELVMQQVAFKSLIERNKEAERQGIIPTSNSSIQLPFIIVNTHKSTKINCSVTNDKSEYIFKFDDKFEMHDDAEVLKRMGLLSGLDKGQCSYDDIERAKTLVPPNFAKYIEAYGNGKGVNMCDSDDDDDDDDLPLFVELTNDSQGYRHTTDSVKSPDLDDEDEFVENSDID